MTRTRVTSPALPSNEAITVSHPLQSGHAPEWASEWGQDKYGVFVGITIAKVGLRFRYIPPGKFRMGSPEDEPERWVWSETQHEVILTRGFWLADTTVTQELWRTVMGNDPSRFQGAQLPVDSVSFDDIERFLLTTRELDPRLELRLPTEAEWEYACRAGTTTPFSLGENITPDLVNYNGEHPYLGSAKGVDRKTSVGVKSLPANPWGLFEMHGNVWEWCSDRGAPFTKEQAIDPIGPSTGSDRVLRGGSWFSIARGCRSADRSWDSPDARYGNFGFRLARGPDSSPSPDPARAGSSPFDRDGSA